MQAPVFATLVGCVLAMQLTHLPGVRQRLGLSPERRGRLLIQLSLIALICAAVLWCQGVERRAVIKRPGLELVLWATGAVYLGWLSRQGLSEEELYPGMMRAATFVLASAYWLLLRTQGQLFFAHRVWLTVPAFVVFVGTILHGWMRRSSP